MLYEIKPWTEPLLRQRMPDFDFTNYDFDMTEFCTNLIETMFEHKGIGLSANQLGIERRVFCMRAEVPFVCFNPRVVYHDEDVVEMDEGCLSFPGIIAKVERPKHIRVRFATPSGVVTTKTFTGLSARCFQHELDHLDGKLFFEGIGRLKMERALKNASKMGFEYTGLMKDAVT